MPMTVIMKIMKIKDSIHIHVQNKNKNKEKEHMIKIWSWCYKCRTSMLFFYPTFFINFSTDHRMLFFYEK